MPLALTLPPLPVRDVPASAETSPDELAALEQRLKQDDPHIKALSAEYDRLCQIADEQGDSAETDDAVQALWDYACASMAQDQRQLAERRPRTRYNAALNALVSRHAEELADLMRTMLLAWDDLELELPDELYTAVWTFRVPPLAYLRAMWNLFWSAIRHPLSETVIELKTGRVFIPEK